MAKCWDTEARIQRLNTDTSKYDLKYISGEGSVFKMFVERMTLSSHHTEIIEKGKNLWVWWSVSLILTVDWVRFCNLPSVFYKLASCSQMVTNRSTCYTSPHALGSRYTSQDTLLAWPFFQNVKDWLTSSLAFPSFSDLLITYNVCNIKSSVGEKLVSFIFV
jgi:hypothetical protein